MVMRPGYPSLTDAKVICEKAPYTGIIDHSIAFNLISQEIAEQRFKTRGELLYARFGNEVSFPTSKIPLARWTVLMHRWAQQVAQQLTFS